MSFQTKWLVEPYILGTSFNSHCSVSELHMVMLEYLGVAQRQEVYFFLDFTDTKPPTGMLSLSSLLQVINHANTRLLLIVKPESSYSQMTQMLSRDKVKIMRERDSALEFLLAMVRLDTGTAFSLKA